jgi:YbbR domain-containing protein
MALGIRHIGLMVLSIGIATAMWFAISGQQIAERALRIPLEYTNMPANLEVNGTAPSVVDVRVRGSSAALNRVAPGDLVAVLDVRTAKAGRRFFHLTGSEVRAPFGLDVVQVTPASIAIEFEQSMTRSVPVVPSLEGQPGDGFQVKTASADPATVEVAGPAASLNRLTAAITEPVSVARATSTIKEWVNIGVTDPSIRLRHQQSAVVTVTIAPVPVERTVSAVNVTVHGARGSVAVRPTKVDVAVRGSKDHLDKLEVSGLAALVDANALSRGQYQLPVHVVAPPDITVVSVEPAQVRVNIR